MKIKNTALLLVAITLISGCVDYRWVKAGMSEHDRQVQLTACEAKALKDLPPDNQVENSRSELSLKDKTDDKKLDENKETYNRITDANASQRDVLIDNCMYQKGWDKVAVN
ncbi:hypothetical protein BL250_15450 [Erwinia sp. OLTSP20]|uniref:hypothetical protein n=1 Tax=unclassified Erwinia TaxID=2622719 RepID=UPI000C18E135|nr:MULTISPECIES: hypothetical protein [unclassified Erwinia]PIJ48603.1 hypothetical protein BV501_16470 [Erwinia sp. OAMSP11]PIJ68957.1 hypothetical protein BK416_15710 [Erwinia sp. OLSSP12]PIJ78829.1 hypothetical protein BLD47_16545 [Erwinia sp. OLCASP19]PIJ79921.1 hypothetical protein BLD46_16360 [Erwinia sp. OLMTSP26]PIJ82039.1 hypothetical protein BLD49_15875 [Erwinia sp. OLMDSP33]